MKTFVLTLIAVLAALVLLALMVCGGLCGAVADLIERAIRSVDRLGSWLMAPLK